jgi:hypothetical protein
LYSPASHAIQDERLYLWSLELSLPDPAKYLGQGSLFTKDMAVPNMDTLKMLTFQIDEPLYYKELRIRHEQDWLASTNSAASTQSE